MKGKYYVVKRKDTILDEYALFVADKIDFDDYDGIWWELSSTDNTKDASKFRLSIDAFNMISLVGLDADDWDVVLYEETK